MDDNEDVTEPQAGWADPRDRTWEPPAKAGAPGAAGSAGAAAWAASSLPPPQWSPPGAGLPPGAGSPPSPWPGPGEGGTPPSRRSSRRRLVAAIVAAAALAATVGVALAGRDSSSSSGSFVPPATDGTVNQQSAATNKLDIGVVDIDTRLGYDNARAAGTGIVLTSSGEVLTNDHVISGATSIKVTVVTTGRTYTATVLGSDATDDIALLQLKDASGLPTVTLGDSSTVAIGDSVTAVGNAGGVGGIPSVATGTVTALDQSITVSDENGGRAEDLSGLIETNAALQPGDSGGPLYDASGKVIGIDTAASGGRRFRVTGRDSFAIAINNATAIRKQIEAGQGSDKVQIGQLGFLGVEISGSASDGSSGGGVPVSSVISGTPAEKIGLAGGDLITAVDGKTVDSEQALTAALHGHHPGDKVKVTWTDSSGQEHSATATLAEGPAG